jgi:iduronate 2-sulfatase
MHDRNAFELASIQGPPTDAPSYAPQQGGELRNYKDIPGSGTLPPELQRTLIHGYYAATSYMDAQAGRVLDELDRLQFTQNTIVVLWGDHGWHLGDHGIWCKHTNYEQAARIPVIVSAPGIKAGVKSKSLIETVDLYPTIAELAGLPAPQGLDGKSFIQALQDGTKPAREYVSHVYPRSTKEKGNLLGRAIRDERYRFVEWKKPGDAPETAEFELYDYVSDPLESANLASKLPAVVASFRSILAKHPEAKPQWQAGSEDSAKSTSASKPKQDRVQMFRRRDKDKDGRLTKEEFLSEQSDPDEAPKRFLKFDANGDGFLSQDEFVFSGKSNN